jgi:hypothetical protein
MTKVNYGDIYKITETKTMDEVLQEIKGGTHSARVDRMRTYLAEGKQMGFDSLKKNLPAFTVSGTFKDKRQEENLDKYSNLVVLDIDKLEMDKLKEVKSKVTSMDTTNAVFISPSGKGLKIIVKHDAESKDHESAYNQIADYYKKECDVEIDRSGKDIARMCFVSHDPELHHNPESSTFKVEAKEVETVAEEAETATIELAEVILQELDDFSKDFEMCKRIADKKMKFEEGNRNNYVYYLANNCNRAGIPPKTALKLILEKYDYNRSEVTNSVRSAYERNSSEFGQYKLKQEDNNCPVLETNEHFVFWRIEKDKLVIDRALYYRFLGINGFGRYYFSVDTRDKIPVLIQVENNVIYNVNEIDILNYTVKYVNSLNLPATSLKEIENAVYASGSLLKKQNLFTLEVPNLNVLEDTRDTSYFGFQNCVVTISKNKINTTPYNELDGQIWHYKIVDRDFVKNEDESTHSTSEFAKFMRNVSTNKHDDVAMKRMHSLMSIAGYLLHDHKDPANAKSVVLMDEDISDNPNGGTGKGLFLKGIAKLTPVVREDGKNFHFNSFFAFSQVDNNTKVLYIEDIKQKFDFERLFSIITDGIIVEKKRQNKFTIPAERSPKIVLTTNYAIQGQGNSFMRRLVEFEFADYYNGEFTPADEFGHNLFNEWDQEQWHLFDNYMMMCVQYFLNNGLQHPPITNATVKKLKEAVGHDYIKFLDDTVKTNEEYERQELYMNFMKDHPKSILKSRQFVLRLRDYADAKGHDFTVRKSNDKYFFKFIEKEHPDQE